jgi:Mu transposase, C-terminal domain
MRCVISDFTISYHAAYYSVPSRLADKRLTVKAHPRTGEIELYDGLEKVADFILVEKRGHVILEEHIAELRKLRWDRARSKVASTQRQSPPDSLAAVPVANRSICDYRSQGGGAMNDLQLDRILYYCQRLGLQHIKASLSDTSRRADQKYWGISNCLINRWKRRSRPGKLGGFAPNSS